MNRSVRYALAATLLAGPACASDFDDARQRGENLLEWCVKTPKLSPRDVEQCLALGRLSREIPLS
jgi:hypothetical protein